MGTDQGKDNVNKMINVAEAQLIKMKDFPWHTSFNIYQGEGILKDIKENPKALSSTNLQ